MPLLLMFLLQAATPGAGQIPAEELARALGIPVAEAEQRMRIADRLGIFQLRAANDPDYAGAYLEHEPTTQAVVLFKGNAAEKLRRYGTEGAGFVARSVDYSLAELAEAQLAATQALSDARIMPLGVGVDIEANRVAVHLADTSLAARLKLPSAVIIKAVEGKIARTPQQAGSVTHFPQAREFAAFGPMAVITGKLFERGGCLRIGEAGGVSRLVLWPATARLAEVGGRVEVTSGDGKLVVGAPATLSGAPSDELPTSEWLIEPVARSCEGPYWIATTSW